MTASVLDSWAIMGWLQGEEPARTKVHELLEQASRAAAKLSISLINVGEVFYLIAKRHGAAPAERFLADLAMMPIQALLPDRKLILAAARLKSRHAISYADAFAAETARDQNAQLVTGDPELWRLSKQEPIDIVWLGSKQAH
ncbi:MAG: type II toxin-antitoxin system VapC family toxin [Terriglobia bacterium]